MNVNPLERYPAVRDKLYLAQWLINGVLGALGVVIVALGESPVWYIITTAVFNFVWTYTGLTAQANTPTPDPEAPYADYSDYDDEGLGLS